MIHQKRRKELLSQLDKDALVIVTTNPEQLRNGDVYYPFRADSDFWYLTGFGEPESVAVFSHKSYTVFLRDRDKAREIWDGKRLGVDDAPKTLKSDQAFSISLIKQELPKLIAKAKTVYYNSKPSKIDVEINKHLSSHQSLTPFLHEMRLSKDNDEIKHMQNAVDISIKAHEMAMKQTKEGVYEYEIASIFDGYFRKNNSQHAYTPIVAGGKNACVLHYIENNKPLKEGDLLLIDAGCEVEGYASDITRTFPISGKFSDAQKQIYQLVLDAQLQAIQSIKPGNNVSKPHQIASNTIRKGLIKLGLLEDDKELSEFYMHGTGHWLGLDVHDVGEYKQANSHRKFEPGMVTTVEPGIYIRKSDKINPVYWNIGIRIEDDVLVTKTGNKVLSQALAKEIDDIELLMR
ncbi:MAG: M24 family metallopeptidase [Candidatus Thioglobus sp.]|nr:M24 family metallopeptidase [Candidatus Thioglobus sp.]